MARAPLPPVPSDASVCRWCGGRKRAFTNGAQLDICNVGCAANDQTPFIGHCEECGRDFETGHPHAVLCHSCMALAVAALALSADDVVLFDEEADHRMFVHDRDRDRAWAWALLMAIVSLG